LMTVPRRAARSDLARWYAITKRRYSLSPAPTNTELEALIHMQTGSTALDARLICHGCVIEGLYIKSGIPLGCREGKGEM
jgi:hypothetical protein